MSDDLYTVENFDLLYQARDLLHEIGCDLLRGARERQFSAGVMREVTRSAAAGIGQALGALAARGGYADASLEACRARQQAAAKASA